MNEMEVYTESLVFVKESRFENSVFYIFQNEAGEFRIAEAVRFSLSNLQSGTVFEAQIRKKGCAGREIIALKTNR